LIFVLVGGVGLRWFTTLNNNIDSIDFLVRNVKYFYPIDYSSEDDDEVSIKMMNELPY
jgi:hypothetical protein